MKIVLLFSLALSTLFSFVGSIEQVRGEVKLFRFNIDLKRLERIDIDLSRVEKKSLSIAKKILSTQAVKKAIENVNSGNYTPLEKTIANREDVLKAKKILKLQRSFPLYKKDVLIVGEESGAIIRLEDNTKINLGSSSKFKIYDFDYSNKPSVKLNFLKGSFKVEIGEIGRIAPKNFIIKTNTKLLHPKTPHTVIGGNISESERVSSLKGEVLVVQGEKRFILKKNQSIDVFNRRTTFNKKDLDGLFREKKSIQYSFNLNNEIIQY